MGSIDSSNTGRFDGVVKTGLLDLTANTGRLAVVLKTGRFGCVKIGRMAMHSKKSQREVE